MQGTQEHDDMAKATDSVMGKRDEKARVGAGVEEGKGDTGCIPPTPRKHRTSSLWIPPPFPWPHKIPSLILPLALMAPPFAPPTFLLTVALSRITFRE